MERLAVWVLAGATYRLAWHNLASLFRMALRPAAVFLTATFVLYAFGGRPDSITGIDVLEFVRAMALVSFNVACCRMILLGGVDDSGETATVAAGFGKREIIFLTYSGLIYGIIFVSGLSLMAPVVMGWGYLDLPPLISDTASWGGKPINMSVNVGLFSLNLERVPRLLVLIYAPFLLVFSAASLLVWARLSFVFPAIAIEAKTGAGLSWEQTRGKGWRIAAVLAVCSLPVIAIATAHAVVTERFVPAPVLGVWSTLFDTTIALVTTAILAVALSLAYGLSSGRLDGNAVNLETDRAWLVPGLVGVASLVLLTMPWWAQTATMGECLAAFVEPHQEDEAAKICGEAARAAMLRARDGNADAQADLGVLFYHGAGVPHDFAEAAKWFRGAAEQGHATAQYNLGILYREGQGVPQDHAEAARRFARAAEQDNADAQLALAVLYYLGQGVSQDPVQAARWMRRAAEKGHPRAQKNMGTFFRDGAGVPQNYFEAEKWFRLAAQSDPSAPEYQRLHGSILLRLGRYDEALVARKRFVELQPENADSYISLGFMLNILQRYEEGLAASDTAIRLNPREAYAHANRAFALGHLGQIDEARLAALEGVRLAPDDAAVWAMLGFAENLTGAFPESIAAFEQALGFDERYFKELDPERRAQLTAFEASRQSRRYMP